MNLVNKIKGLGGKELFKGLFTNLFTEPFKKSVLVGDGHANTVSPEFFSALAKWSSRAEAREFIHLLQRYEYTNISAQYCTEHTTIIGKSFTITINADPTCGVVINFGGTHYPWHPSVEGYSSLADAVGSKQLLRVLELLI